MGCSIAEILDARLLVLRSLREHGPGDSRVKAKEHCFIRASDVGPHFAAELGGPNSEEPSPVDVRVTSQVKVKVQEKLSRF